MIEWLSSFRRETHWKPVGIFCLLLRVIIGFQLLCYPSTLATPQKNAHRLCYMCYLGHRVFSGRLGIGAYFRLGKLDGIPA